MYMPFKPHKLLLQKTQSTYIFLILLSFLKNPFPCSAVTMETGLRVAQKKASFPAQVHCDSRLYWSSVRFEVPLNAHQLLKGKSRPWSIFMSLEWQTSVPIEKFHQEYQDRSQKFFLQNFICKAILVLPTLGT